MIPSSWLSHPIGTGPSKILTAILYDKFLADIGVSEAKHKSSDRFAGCGASSTVRVCISGNAGGCIVGA